MAGNRGGSRLVGALANLALAAAAVVLSFALVEGLASGVLLLRGLLGGEEARASVAEHLHTRYDAELGWTHVPNAHVEDLYGPGASLRTNGQGFRGEGDVPRQAPPGTLRVVCSGDSFTLGYGVADAETWCANLRFPGREVVSVNMGQGGYGIDQAWLWYLRDGVDLEHALHVFAFIYPDFERMTRLSLMGYGKPRVRATPDGLAVENVPVPAAGVLHGWLRRHRQSFGGLRVLELLGPILSHPRPPPDYDRFPPYSERDAVATALEIFSETQRVNRERGRATAFVYLPALYDLGKEGARLDAFRVRLAASLRRRGLHYTDLTAEFRALTPQRVDALFIDAGAGNFRHAKGHYTAEGNAFVAELLSERLRSLVE